MSPLGDLPPHRSMGAERQVWINLAVRLSEIVGSARLGLFRTSAKWPKSPSLQASIVRLRVNGEFEGNKQRAGIFAQA